MHILTNILFQHIKKFKIIPDVHSHSDQFIEIEISQSCYTNRRMKFPDFILTILRIIFCLTLEIFDALGVLGSSQKVGTEHTSQLST